MNSLPAKDFQIMPCFGKYISDIKFSFSQTEIIKKKGITKLARIQMKDVPMSKKKFYQSFKRLGEDKNFMKYLASICQPEQKEVLHDWIDNHNQILKIKEAEILRLRRIFTDIL